MSRKESIKPILLSFTLIYSFVMLIGSTFSWMTDGDSVINEFESGDLHTVIQAVLDSNLAWAAGTVANKELCVKNTGSAEALVRIKLTESFLSFKFENSEETGGLTDNSAPSEGEKIIKYEDISTWRKDWIYKENDVNYVGNAFISCVGDKAQTDRSDNETERVNTALKYIQIIQPYLKTGVDSKTSEPYWIYDAGWFYYSEIVKPGATTKPLIEKLKLAENLPHIYKFALYKMDIIHEAIIPAKGCLSAWEIYFGSSVYNLLGPKL